MTDEEYVSIRQRIFEILDRLYTNGKITLEIKPSDVKDVICREVPEACEGDKWLNVSRRYVYEWVKKKRREIELTNRLRGIVHGHVEKVLNNSTREMYQTPNVDGERVEVYEYGGDGTSEKAVEKDSDAIVAEAEIDAKSIMVTRRFRIDPRLLIIYQFLKTLYPEKMRNVAFDTFVNGSALAYWREKNLEIAVLLTGEEELGEEHG